MIIIVLLSLKKERWGVERAIILLNPQGISKNNKFLVSTSEFLDISTSEWSHVFIFLQSTVDIHKSVNERWNGGECNW